MPADRRRLPRPAPRRPEPGQTQERRPPTRYVVPGGTVCGPYAIEVTLSNPYTFRATALGQRHRAAAVDRALRARRRACSSRRSLARRVHDAAAPADRGLARPRRGRPRRGGCPRAERPRRLVRDRRAARSSSTRWPTGSRRASRSSAATATGAATSWPTSRTSCARRSPRSGPSTSCSRERAGDDPEARAEFLESSGQQIERLDWLAQNLLELSKLDSGLVLLDLRPDDLRAAVETAVEQTRGGRAARRRASTSRLPRRAGPDPPRPAADRPGRGQPRRQRRQVHAARRVGRRSTSRRRPRRRADRGRATPASASTPAELPHIFERFYRGSRANEARGSGSGLGLAIVRSIVDMHRRQRSWSRAASGSGTTLHVTLPRTRASRRGRRPRNCAAVASADRRTRAGGPGGTWRKLHRPTGRR